MSQIFVLFIVSILFDPSIRTFFFSCEIPRLLKVLRVFPMSRLNLIFMVSDTIAQSFQPCGISVSMRWSGYARFDVFPWLNVLSCLWKRIVFYVWHKIFFHINTHSLFIYNFNPKLSCRSRWTFCILWWIKKNLA